MGMGGDLLRGKILTRLFPNLTIALILMAAVQLGAETPEFESPSRSQRQVPSAKPERFIRQTQGGQSNEKLPSSIPGLDNPLTQRYIRQYSASGGLAWLRAVMDRGGPYLGFILREVRERNLPPELVYLPVIESGFLTTAVSRSGAAGLWQFMRNSIGGYGMGITDYADERMDFWKSTQGALKKLEDNYKQLGDWPLALAAYNAGMGGVNRLVQQTGVRDYWTLSERRLLKTETIHYVPKLLAVSYILSNPRQFGFSPPWPEDPQWTRISLDRSIDLELLAEYAGIDRDMLKKGNPELRYTITPPVKGYQLKVPQADVPAVLAALEREDLSLIRYHFHTIGYGDTISALAQHYRLSVDQILAANPGAEARFLQIGKKLRIPAITNAGPYQRQPAGGSGNLVFEGTHLVKRGETLWSIALAYEVDPQSLADANNMGLNDVLREGRILKTPIIR
ncbi:transglycosylase SLT domain-containing protein [Treponema primitia]|uniref:lytic transglycosylase domain-containing protein n=1 Tax=Treponema primitia TaxID=88058 RepID=UPI0039802DAB